MLAWLDAEHDVFVSQDGRDRVHYETVQIWSDKRTKNYSPPPERAFPRRTMSGLMLSYSHASILPVRHKP